MNSKIAKILFPTVAGTVVGFSTILASFGTALALQSTVITSPNTHAISNVVLYLQNSSGSIIKVKVDNFSAVSGETKTYDPSSVVQKYSGYTLVAYTVKAGDNKSNMGSGEGELFIISGSGVQQSQLPTSNTTDANTYQYKNVYSTTTVSNSTPTTTTTNSTTNSQTSTNTQTTPVSQPPIVSSETSTNTQTTPVSEPPVVSSETNSNTQTTPVSEPPVVGSETNSNTQTTPVSEPPVVSSETNSNTQTTPVSEPPIVSANASTTQPVSVPEPGTITAVALFGLGGLFTKKKLKSSSK